MFSPLAFSIEKNRFGQQGIALAVDHAGRRDLVL